MGKGKRMGKSLPQCGEENTKGQYEGWATEWDPSRKWNRSAKTGERTGPPGYEEKFANFISMCNTLGGIVPYVTIPYPELLGDNFDEIVESLNRLSDAGLMLGVFNRNPEGQPQPIAMIQGWPDFVALRRTGTPYPRDNTGESGGETTELGQSTIEDDGGRNPRESS